MDIRASRGQTGPPAGPTLEGIEWRLSGHLGPGGMLVQVTEDVIATASFVEGRVLGTTGCNAWSRRSGSPPESTTAVEAS